MSGAIQLEAITKVEGKKQTKQCFENSTSFLQFCSFLTMELHSCMA